MNMFEWRSWLALLTTSPSNSFVVNPWYRLFFSEAQTLFMWCCTALWPLVLACVLLWSSLNCITSRLFLSFKPQRLPEPIQPQKQPRFLQRTVDWCESRGSERSNSEYRGRKKRSKCLDMLFSILSSQKVNISFIIYTQFIPQAEKRGRETFRGRGSTHTPGRGKEAGRGEEN